MKITKRQIKKIIIKEFKRADISSYNFGDIVKGDSGFTPPPDFPTRGDGGGGRGSNCEDPSGGDGRFDDAYGRVLDAFEAFLITSDLDYMSYFDHLASLGIKYELSMDFLSDGMLYEIALDLCKQKIIDEMLPEIFSNPYRFV